MTRASSVSSGLAKVREECVGELMRDVEAEPSTRPEASIFDLVNAKMSWEKFKPAIVQIYAEVYTDEELDGILAFYRSPAGHAMIEKMPQLMSRTMAVAQKLMGDIQPEIEKMVKESAPKDKK